MASRHGHRRRPTISSISRKEPTFISSLQMITIILIPIPLLLLPVPSHVPRKRATRMSTSRSASGFNDRFKIKGRAWVNICPCAHHHDTLSLNCE